MEKKFEYHSVVNPFGGKPKDFASVKLMGITTSVGAMSQKAIIAHSAINATRAGRTPLIAPPRLRRKPPTA